MIPQNEPIMAATARARHNHNTHSPALESMKIAPRQVQKNVQPPMKMLTRKMGMNNNGWMRLGLSRVGERPIFDSGAANGLLLGDC